MRPVRGLLSHTFEYEAVGKDDPGYVETRIEFMFTAGTPETGGGYMADPELYDPGSGHEVEYLHAERETQVDGASVWVKLIPGEWLDQHCRAWLDNEDEIGLQRGLPYGMEDY